jgi:hypothetical protein
MDLKETKVEVSSLPFDERGEKIEPEAQPARLIQSGDAPLEHANTPAGSFPVSVEQHLSAGALAATVRDPCGTCKYFNRSVWIKHVKIEQSSHEGRQRLNAVLAELIDHQHAKFQDLHRGNDGDFDTDHALYSLGRCSVLSEIHRDDVVMHPLSCCPPELRSFAKPRGMYEAVDRDTERAGAAGYDKVLAMARKNEKL